MQTIYKFDADVFMSSPVSFSHHNISIVNLQNDLKN